jgi:hypothetical protein
MKPLQPASTYSARRFAIQCDGPATAWRPRSSELWVWFLREERAQAQRDASIGPAPMAPADDPQIDRKRYWRASSQAARG